MAIISKLKSAVKNVLLGATIPGQVIQFGQTLTGKKTPLEAAKTSVKGMVTSAAFALPVAKVAQVARAAPILAKVASKTRALPPVVKAIGKSAALSVAGTGAVYLAKKALTAPGKVVKSGAAKAIAAGALTGAAIGYGAAKLSGSEALQQQALYSGLASTGDEMGVLSRVSSYVKQHPIASGAIGGLIGAGAGYAGYKAVKAFGVAGQRRRSSRSNIITKRGMKTLRKIKKYRKQIRKAMSAIGIKGATSQSKGFTPFRRRKK